MRNDLTPMEAHMLAALDAVLPLETTDESREKILAECVRALRACGIKSGLDSINAANLVCAGYDLRTAQEFEEIATGAAGPRERKFAQQIVTALHTLYGQFGRDDPLPPNKFMVTRYHDTISIPEFKVSQLDPTDARNLGVWLIAVSDPTLKDAPRELLAVATR